MYGSDDDHNVIPAGVMQNSKDEILTRWNNRISRSHRCAPVSRRGILLCVNNIFVWIAVSVKAQQQPTHWQMCEWKFSLSFEVNAPCCVAAARRTTETVMKPNAKVRDGSTNRRIDEYGEYAVATWSGACGKRGLCVYEMQRKNKKNTCALCTQITRSECGSATMQCKFSERALCIIPNRWGQRNYNEPINNHFLTTNVYGRAVAWHAKRQAAHPSNNRVLRECGWTTYKIFAHLWIHLMSGPCGTQHIEGREQR